MASITLLLLSSSVVSSVSAASNADDGNDIFVCDICGGTGEEIIYPDAEVDLGASNLAVKCSIVGSAATGGLIAESDCPAVALFASDVCCGVPASLPGSESSSSTASNANGGGDVDIFVCDI